MASIEDIGNALSDIIQDAVYPNGIEHESVANCDIGIMTGWPVPKVLDDELKKGHAVVSIYPCEIERNTSRGLGNQWEDISIAVDGITGVSGKETKRQEKQFQITVWTATPDKRAIVANVIDSVLSDTLRLQFSDDTVGNMQYTRTYMDDKLEKEDVYKTDLFYQIEYATVRTQVDNVVKHVRLDIKNWDGVVIATETI